MAELPSGEDAASDSAGASGQDGDSSASRCGLRGPYASIIRHLGSADSVWPGEASVTVADLACVPRCEGRFCNAMKRQRPEQRQRCPQVRLECSPCSCQQSNEL